MQLKQYDRNNDLWNKSPEYIVNLKILQGREYSCVNLEAHDRPWIHIKGFLQKYISLISY